MNTDYKKYSRSPSPSAYQPSRKSYQRDSPDPVRSRSRSPLPKSRNHSSSPRKPNAYSRSRSISRSHSRHSSPRRSHRHSRRYSRNRSLSYSRNRSRSPSERKGYSSYRNRFSRGPLEKSKIYVGNLNFKTREEDLRDIYEKFGHITDVFLPRDARGQYRGFGFVTFEDCRDADRASRKTDKIELDGRILEVNIARQKSSYPREKRNYEGNYSRTKSQEKCRDFERGRCHRGSQCRYAHGTPASISRSRSKSRRSSRSVSNSKNKRSLSRSPRY